MGKYEHRVSFRPCLVTTMIVGLCGTIHIPITDVRTICSSIVGKEYSGGKIMVTFASSLVG